MDKPVFAKGPRDVRLDFFRGLAMLVIFIAHVPENSWNGFIPARFGFSNATEMFVFGSGFASALAFGGVFVKRGWFLGVARILHRCWQVYWAHIGLFLVIASMYLLAHAVWPTIGYVENQGLEPLVQHPLQALPAILTLRWQADYLDILPMYLVILALIPVMMAARKAHKLMPFAVSLLLYGLAFAGVLDLSANPWTGRSWYFNPFSWQLIFFLGFAFAAGWLKPVILQQRLPLAFAGLVLVVALPLSFWGFHQIFPELMAVHEKLLPTEWQQTYLHPLRLLHFLALAYVVLSLIDPWRQHIGAGWSAPVVKVGQQSLAAFLSSLALARASGIALDVFGRSEIVVAAVNISGLLLVVLAAHLAGWFKSAPWSKQPQVQVPGVEQRSRNDHKALNERVAT